VSPSQLCASIFHSCAQILIDDHGFRKIPAVQLNETHVKSVVKPPGEKKGIPLSPGKKESPLPDFWFLRKLRAFPRTDAKIKTHLNVSVQVDSRTETKWALFEREPESKWKTQTISLSGKIVKNIGENPPRVGLVTPRVSA